MAGERVGLAALIPYLRQHRATLIVVAALSLIAAGAALVQPLLIRTVLDGIGASQPIAGPVALLVVLVLAGAALDGLRSYLLQRTAEGVVLTTRRRLAGHLLRLPIAEYDARRTGDLLSRVGADSTLLRAVVTSGLFDVVSGAVMVVGATIAMLAVDPLLFGVAVVALAGGMTVALTVSRRVRGLSEQAQARIGEMTSAVERAISAARTIRAAGAEQREAATVGGSAQAAYAAGMRVARLEATVGPVATAATQGAFLLVLASAAPGWRPAGSPSATWWRSSCSCSSWCCRSARRCTRTPSCRPGWARCSGSRRSWRCRTRPPGTGRWWRPTGTPRPRSPSTA